MSLPDHRVGVLDAYRSRAILGCVITFTITSTFSLVLRLMAKRMKKTSLCAEDWFIIAAQVGWNTTLPERTESDLVNRLPSTAWQLVPSWVRLHLILVYCSSVLTSAEVVIGGAGHHVWDVSHKVTNFLKVSLVRGREDHSLMCLAQVLVAMQVFYATTLGLIKISICLFLARIFSAANHFRLWSYAVIAFITAWSTMVILTAFVLCQPVAFNWDNTIPGGKCANQPAAFLAIGILDLMVDLMVLVLPLPMIWNLQLPLTNKIALFAIFGVGVS